MTEGSGDRAERRREFINNITNGTVEKTGELRKVIQLSDNEAQLEELDRVLRAWRVLGRKVSNQTAKELVGKFESLLIYGSASRIVFAVYLGATDVSDHSDVA